MYHRAMATAQLITPRRLKTMVKESVKEVFDAELMKLRSTILPFISEQEQKDIERRYKKPSHRVAKTYTLEI